VVLAGGESRRFGSPKALATFRGEPLWRRAARVLQEVGAPVLVVANAPDVVASVASAGSAVAEVRGDLRPGDGPLAGIETGLTEARGLGLEGIFALACDLALVETDMVGALARAWPGRGVATFEAPGPWGVAPLCSVWGVELLGRVADALSAGRRSVGELMLGLDGAWFDLDTARPGADPALVFRSANTPDDLALLEAGVPRT
jgi:molybdopterin-guanine dinucleotide biosynthesis protein A